MSRLSRRRLLQGSVGLAGLSLIAGCGVVPLRWQQTTKLPRIGYLGLSPVTRSFELFRDGLRDLGYVEGQTIVIEARWAESTEQLPALAGELVSLPVDVLVAGGTTQVKAAMDATRVIPIVFPNIGDPVGSGFVASLARPGGNVTGLSDLSVQAAGKRVQLLREVLPGVSRVLYLTDTAVDEVNGSLGLGAVREAARSVGIQLLTPAIRTAADLSTAFDMATVERAEALLASETPLIASDSEVGRRIVEFATVARLPLMSKNPPFVVAGGLISYGVNTDTLFRRAATYVDKILKGARPADLPIEQVTEFTLAINLRTAQTLGLTIPPSVLAQATEVIQ